MPGAVTVASVHDFQLDAATNVRVHPAHQAFDYADGAEQRILEILRAAADVGSLSTELLGHIADWPTLYHFSPARHNLLRHLQFDRDIDVLELGAGCGAITRYLGEVAGAVWAVEGGRTRAACAASRTRDLSNVQVFCSDFQAIDPGRQFDVVTLIGVLEYAPKFFKSADPLLACLQVARSLLKPGGVLVVAIENQLGLKYLCGAPEDHTGRPYEGVQDLYRPDGARTMGRRELGDLLQRAGFPHLQFQYPFPDYKLPRWVLPHRAFETTDFDPCAILRLVQPVHDGQPMELPADERRIRTVLHRNGLLPELANSFLILAGSSPELIANLSPTDLLAAGAVVDRHPNFNTRTLMRRQPGGQIQVHKDRLSAAPAGQDSPLQLNVPAVEPYHTGDQLEHLVVQELQRQNLDRAIELLRQWVDYVISSGLVCRDETDVFDSQLRPEYFDCNPRNLIVDSGTLHRIDTEWLYHGQLSLRTEALRYLKPFVSQQRALLDRHLKGWQPPAMQLAQRLGIDVTKRQYGQANQLRREINRLTAPPRQVAVRRGKSSSLLRRLVHWTYRQ